MEVCGEEVTEENLSSRDLSQLPSGVAQNTHLVNLYIDYNDIEQLPHDFGNNLPSLKLFSALGNSLSCIPKAFGAMTKLEELYLNENDIRCLPDSICGLKCLKVLNVTGNGLESLPINFGEIASLEKLHCDENSISQLPKTFGLLENLQELEMGSNAIASLSECFGMLKSLQILNLSNNKLSSLPESFGDLTNLRIMDLSANKLKRLPVDCKSSHCLEKMYFDTNLLEELPGWISELPNVVEFSLKDNQFQNQPLPDIFPKRCKKLKHLNMSGNFMSKLPAALGEMCELEFLHFGSVIDELERRNFQNGNWLPEMPSSICQLVHLKELHFDENRLSELPDDFGNLVSLEFLDIGQNMVHELPETFGNLHSLKVCLLSKNNIQWLPSNIGELSSLIELRLDDNKLVELPESFDKLTTLKTLDLFSNRLREIPSALRSLTGLIRLDLNGNDFSLPWSDIPQLATGNVYPIRDPALKDNWRGKARTDNTMKDEEDIIVQQNGSVDVDLEFEPPPEPLDVSEDVLIAAMRRNMSIWRSHTDTSGRRVSRRPTQSRQQRFSNEEEDWSEEEQDDTEQTDEDDDDNFEPPIFVKPTQWSGSKEETVPSPTTCLFEEQECWEDEVDSSIVEQYDNVPSYLHQHPTKVVYPPVENGQFTFAPFDIHEADYVKQPNRYAVEENQFDNCDNDDTELVSVDPIF